MREVRDYKEQPSAGRLIISSLALSRITTRTGGILMGLFLVDIGLTFGASVGVIGQISTLSSVVAARANRCLFHLYWIRIFFVIEFEHARAQSQPPEARRATETTPESGKSQKTPEFIRASGEICKKVKFYPPERADYNRWRVSTAHDIFFAPNGDILQGHLDGRAQLFARWR